MPPLTSHREVAIDGQVNSRLDRRCVGGYVPGGCRGGPGQGLAGAVDVALQGARQSAYSGILHRTRHRLHGLEIAGTGNREAGLDNVDLHALQRPGDAYLFVFGHGCAGTLLAVAQGGVEYDQTIAAHDLLHRGLRRLLRPQHTKEARRVRIDYSRVSGCCV